MCRPRDITWHEDNWDNPDSRFLAWTLHDNREGGSGDVYIAFNAHGFEVRKFANPAWGVWCVGLVVGGSGDVYITFYAHCFKVS
jgi:hypothetical protein